MFSILYLLNWPTLIYSVHNIRGWNYLPGSDARGALGTFHIGLCATLINYLSNICLIFSGYYSHFILLPSISYSLSIYYSSLPVSSPISSAVCPNLIPRISISGCSQHLRESHIPGLRSAARHNFMIGQVVMYCETMFWRQVIYTPISYNPTVSSTSPMVWYTHVPSR